MGLKEIQEEGYNPFVEALKPPEVAKATGPRRLASLAIRGATLGTLGAASPAEGLVENAVEMAGSLPTIAGISAVASPVTGAALRGLAGAGRAVSPALARLTAAGATGGVVGATEAAMHGEDVLPAAAKSAAGFVGGEGAFLAGGRLLGALRGARSAAEATRPTVEAVSKEVSDLPQWTPRSVTGAPAVESEIQAGYPQIRFGPDNSAAGKNTRMTGFGPGAGRTTLDDLITPVQPFTPSPTMPAQRPTAGMAFPPQTQQPHFTWQEDPTAGRVLVPSSPQAIDAVMRAELLGRDNGGIPITPMQKARIAENPVKLDVVAQREPLLTTNVLIKTPEEVEAIMAANPNGVEMGRVIVADKTPESKALASTLNGIGVSDDEAQELVQQATQRFATEEAATKGRIRKSKEQRAAEASGKAPYVKDTEGVEGQPGQRLSRLTDKPIEPVREGVMPGASLVTDPKTGEKIVFAPTPDMTAKQRKAWIAEQLRARCKPGGAM